MKKKKQELDMIKGEIVKEKDISRKDAIKKAGYIAVSAATMMMLVGYPKTAAASPAPERNW